MNSEVLGSDLTSPIDLRDLDPGAQSCFRNSQYHCPTPHFFFLIFEGQGPRVRRQSRWSILVTLPAHHPPEAAWGQAGVPAADSGSGPTLPPESGIRSSPSCCPLESTWGLSARPPSTGIADTLDLLLRRTCSPCRELRWLRAERRAAATVLAQPCLLTGHLPFAWLPVLLPERNRTRHALHSLCVI